MEITYKNILIIKYKYSFINLLLSFSTPCLGLSLDYRLKSSIHLTFS